ncbi:MAG: hypothetical protein LIO65_05780, partial [Odoribacter sp.]|nr:hypothetical protein [Odoribacter sp.]
VYVVFSDNDSFLTSCQEDHSLSEWSESSKEALISEAREFFEEKISDAVTRGTLIKDKSWSPGEVVPEWDKASFKRNEKYEYVFVPIFSQKHYVGRYRMKKRSGDKFSYVRISQVLCIRRNADGVYSAAYLTLMPSKAYYNAHKNKVANEYLKSSNFHGNFTGRVAYNDIVSFQLLAVDKLDKGEVEWGFSRKTAGNRESFNESYREMFKYISIIEVAATRGDPIELEEVVVIACRKCGRDLEKGETCNCDEEEPHPGGGDDRDPWEDDEDDGDDWIGEDPGGGSKGKGDGNNVTTKTNPKVTIPKKLKIQPENTKKCVPYCVYYALTVLGEDAKLRDLIRAFKNEFGIKFWKDGVTIDQLNEYIETYYDTGDYTKYAEVVDAGYFVVLAVQQGTIYHALLLVGYASNGNLIVLDPLTGKQRTIHPSEVKGVSKPFSPKK